MSKNKKTYVLDTNILMTNPNAIYGFADNNVVITGTTLQELDAHKEDKGERGFNVRESARILDELRLKGDLNKGVELHNGGKLFLEANCIEDCLPQGYSLSIADNRIIAAVLGMEKSDKYPMPVILVTNDLLMRINASACGVTVQSYKNEMIEDDEAYTGRCFIEWPDPMFDIYGATEYPVPEDIELEENEYVILKNGNVSALCVHKSGMLYRLNDKELTAYGIEGRNAPQKMLMHALLAPADEIPLVICKGPAGTGKTLLAIACALEQTYASMDNKKRNKDQKYESVMITRTNTISDNDLGFLPGTLEEKMDPLIAPFMDNMKTIFAGKERDLDLAAEQIEYVMGKGIVNIAAVGYLRGRSLPNTYLIVDEAQNMTVHQALEIVTRAGEGTKVVLLGDPNQIDARYLDKRNNGLVFAAEKMKGSKLCAQITFEEEEAQRSALCVEAAKRMTL